MLSSSEDQREETTLVEMDGTSIAVITPENGLVANGDWSGAMEGEILSSYSRLIQSVTDSPGWRAFWEERNYVFSSKTRKNRVFLLTLIMLQSADIKKIDNLKANYPK